jgi:hypothetical protein
LEVRRQRYKIEQKKLAKKKNQKKLDKWSCEDMNSTQRYISSHKWKINYEIRTLDYLLPLVITITAYS